MVARNIHTSEHRIAVRLVRRGKDTRKEVCDVVEFSMSTLEWAVRRERETGTVEFPAAQGRGQPRKLKPGDVHYILQLRRHRPSMYLREYQHLLEKNRLVRVPLSTIHNVFVREEITRKRTSKVAIERDPIKRAGYRLSISKYHAYQLVCADEMSKDDRTYARPYARAEKGMRAEEDGEFVRHDRFSLCAALALDAGIIAARVVEGSFNRDLFEDYIMNDVLPVMNPFPGPRSVLVLDNARIHHGPEIIRKIQERGCLIEYLSPYSPDYDPIEQGFSVIKSWLRDQGISASLDNASYYELYRACQVITPEMTWGFFSHSGYLL